MTPILGVDFGTTHTSAAVFDGQQLTFLPLDPHATDPTLLRSILYVTRQHDHLLGREAVESYLREETGRLVLYEDKVVGTVENTVARMSRSPLEPDGPITLIYDVLAAEDVSTHGRLLQSIKTALREADYEGTHIYGRFYPLEELIALLLRHVRRCARHQLGQEIDALLLGRPVQLASEAQDDQRAQARLCRAAELAGFRHIAFEREPLAAARFYTHRLARPETLFVFDFGGGTLDMTLLRVAPPASPHILATQGVLVGGDDLDSALMMHHVAPHLGVGAAIDADGAPLPHQLAALLRRWQTIPQLSRPQPLTLIRRAQRLSDQSAAFAALEKLVVQNEGFQLFETLERGKRTLSERETAVIAYERLGLRLPLTRSAFQRAIVSQLAQVQRGLTQILATADLPPEQVDTVVTTGGSSLIPIFQTILANRFPCSRFVRSNTFGSVTAGLAICAHELARD